MIDAHLLDNVFQFDDLGRRAAGIDIPQQHAELVAAKPRHHVGGAHLAAQRGGHRLEQRIAGGMAVPVVDAFKTVEIDHHQSGIGAVALHISERARQFALEASAIENIQQRIDIGAGFKLGDSALGRA